MYGEHSVLNSLAVIAIAYLEHQDMTAVSSELATFSGVKRRFSESVYGDVVVIDDYAHHPSEINATIDAARQKYPDREIVAVFQPHTYSRLQAYLAGFGEALRKADLTFVTPIFGSIREQAGNISSQDLIDLVPGAKGIDGDSLDQLKALDKPVIIFMGAGDIEKYEDQFVATLK